MNNKVIKLTNKEEFQAFKNNNRRAIIFYSAKWCKACNDILPLYTSIANRYYKRIVMAHADIDVCNLDFSKIPVFVAYYCGKSINHMIGANPDGLKDFIKEAILFQSTRERQNRNRNNNIIDTMNSAQEYQLRTIK